MAGCLLTHESRQHESGLERDVAVELQAVAVGELAAVLASAGPGVNVTVSGFLAAKSLRSRAPVLHLNKIEFVEGY